MPSFMPPSRSSALAKSLLLGAALFCGSQTIAADVTAHPAAQALQSESWRKFVSSVERHSVRKPDVPELEQACRGYVERSTAQDESALLGVCLSAAARALPDVGQYTTPARAEAQRMSSATSPFGSIGIEIGRRGKTFGPIHVVKPMENSPAERGGVMAGDDIHEIDGRDITGLEMDKAILGFRGKPGSMVRIRLARGEDARMVTLDIKREVIRVSYARSHWVAPDALWARVYNFGAKASQDLARQLRHQFTAAQKRTPRVLILDLRNCPGGSLVEIQEALSVFVPTDTIVGWERGRSETTPLLARALKPESTDEVAQAEEVWRQVPLVVLVDEGTGSGAELLAQALRQHRKAVLVGETTAGAANIDQNESLPNGARVSFPRSYMLAADKSSWSGQGLVPDVKAESGPRVDYGTKNDPGVAAALRQ